jgi:hypothetical protein
METNSGSSKFDLRPWLFANSAKISVIFPFPGSMIELSDKISSLFGHFLPNMRAIVLIETNRALDQSLREMILNRYGDRIHLIPKAPDVPIGISILEGFSVALDQGSTKIIQLPLGSEEQFNYLPDMLRFAEQYDLVTGSRFLKNQEFICPQKQAQYNIDRWFQGYLLKNFLGGKITDGNSGVRCWSRVALKVVLTRLRLRNPYLLNLEMAYLSYRTNLKVIEIPIAYQPTVMQLEAIPQNSLHRF